MAGVLFQPKRRTALMGAASRGHLDVTQVLLERGCDIEATDVCYRFYGQQILIRMI